ncbi:MAG TPA: radical SAM family heme chaperone HemW [Clostridiales bacterium]|nr:radical SAM family heme chaperone HemW [Clostridiales bacterium]
MILNDGELGLYVHIPFCKSKCYYCDFNSYASKEYLISSYCEALIKEIEYYGNLAGTNRKPGEHYNSYQIKSIYLGGGTPTHIPPQFILQIIEKCRNNFFIKDEAEITLEANPGTLSDEKLEVYRNAGVNRLSIGLQAWQDRLLKMLGRIHNVQDFISNVNAAQKLGIGNISVDLIFGLPMQTLDEWFQTLDEVLKLNIMHLSCYSLKVEEDTVLEEKIRKGELPVPDEDIDREMYHNTILKLKSKGFKHYEISNFSKPGFESRHNLIYWKAEEYIGLGAGAHSYFEGKRYNNEVKPEKYISEIQKGNIPMRNIVSLSEKDRICEFLILGLRLTDGVDTQEFKNKFGKDLFELYGANVDILIKRGLLEIEGEIIRLTPLGLDLANQVFIEFI